MIDAVETFDRRRMLGYTATSVVSSAVAGGTPAAASPDKAFPAAVRHGYQKVGAANVFYREAGSPTAPTILLLHGFANSLHYFRHLMPILASRYRVIAPDLPSFGFTEIDPASGYKYTFASLSETIKGFVDALDLRRYAIYVFDYGAPVGFDLALTYPDRIAGIISQNGNVYVDGLGGEPWKPLFDYWEHRSDAAREIIRSRLTLDGVKSAYFQGVADPGIIEPEAYWLDAAILAKPGNAEIQVDLKLDYNANIARYPLYQAFLRESRPPVLAIWGRNDLFFVPPGAEAFRRDVPDARVTLLDTGHFALETNLDAIAASMMSMA